MADWVREIATRLSPAQEHALLWLAADGSLKAQEKGVSSTSLWVLRSKLIVPHVRAELVKTTGGDKFENGKWSPRYWSATPLGLAVKRFIEDDANG